MLLIATHVAAQTAVYWDTNGSAGGAGGATPAGTWDNATTANWTTSTGGNLATSKWTTLAGASGNATFSAGASATGTFTVTVSGTVSNVGGITFQDGTVTLGGAGILSLTGTAAVDVASTATISAILGGTGTLNKTGAGTLTLSGVNTYTGATTVTAGTLLVNSSNLIPNTSALTVASGATFDLNYGANETVSSLTGAGNVNLRTNTLAVGDGTNTTFTGVISDMATFSGNIVKQGTGMLTLTGANNYGGLTTVNAGVLNIQNNTALGYGGTGVTIASGAALQLQNNITVTGKAVSIRGTGVGATGALRNISGANTWAGDVNLAAASQIQSDAGTLTISGNVNSTNLGLTVAGAGNTALSGVVGLGTGTLTKSGAGTLTLSGANTYTGLTAINAGTLQIGASNSLPSGTAVTIASGATFNINNLTQTVGSVAGAGAITLGTGTLTAGGNNTSTVFGGTLTGAGSFVKAGTGTLSLSSNINFGGTFVLSGGTLQLSGTTLTLGTLNITGNSIIDFAGAAATLSVTNLFIQAGSSLTILNWQNAVDKFTATTWSGATYNLMGSAPMNQITFTGNSANVTGWDSYDSQIRPNVPEPATYGALLMGGVVLASLLYKRLSFNN